MSVGVRCPKPFMNIAFTWQKAAFVCIVVLVLCIVVLRGTPPQPTQTTQINALSRNTVSTAWACTRRQIWTKTPTKQSVYDARPEPTYVSRKTCTHEVHPSEIAVGVFHCMQSEPTRIVSIMETWGNQPDGLTVTVTYKSESSTPE